MMKIYGTENVYDAAVRRVNRIFDEFDQVIVGFSGGKDSVVVLNLALEIAEQRGLLPLPVIFLDQEAEWTTTIEFVREIMYDPRINPYWMQIPFKIYNATSTTDDWLECWEAKAKDKWIHPQDPISYKENKYGTDRFGELFDAIILKEFGTEKSVGVLAGVRCQESPSRAVGLTSHATYKDITWGRVNLVSRGKNPKVHHYTFYPLYDWEISDVWKSIFDNGWKYCKLYDIYYQYGIPIGRMRLSNVHHETAVSSLWHLQELDPVVWERLVVRIGGINTAGQMTKSATVAPKELPSMFESWKEYRNYLAENLITDEKKRQEFFKIFEHWDKIYVHNLIQTAWSKCAIGAILANDTGNKLKVFHLRPTSCAYARYVKAGFKLDGTPHSLKNPYIQEALCLQN